MKKLLSVIVAVAAIVVMPITSLAAEETITQETEEKSGNINVDYDMEISYTVTIPASVTFTNTEKTVERGIQAINVFINEGSTLNVNIASLNNFKMKNGEAEINYSLMVNYNDTPKTNNYTILTVEAGEHSGLAILSFITELKKDNALYAGNYNDTLTFTVSVD